jgi:hypothetical protein
MIMFIIDNQNSFTGEFWLINDDVFQSIRYVYIMLLSYKVLHIWSQHLFSACVQRHFSAYAELMDSLSVGIFTFFMFCVQFYVSLGRWQLTGLLYLNDSIHP